MMKKIGLVVAIEMNAVLQKYGEPKEKLSLSGYKINIYKTKTYTLYAIASGAGEIAAAISTQFLIDHFNVDIILNFGVVGALSERLKLAELCVVKSVIHYDFTTVGWINLETGHYPQFKEPYISTDEELRKLALSVCPNLVEAKCASADKFIDDSKEKAALNEKYGADICEMEAAGIVITAERNNVPCLLIKAISDSLVGGGKEFMRELVRVSNICFEAVDQIINTF